MRWCISFLNISKSRVPVPSDFRKIDKLWPTFLVFMVFFDVKYWFWRQFWMSHFWVVLKTLKRCKSVCLRVRGMMLYIFLFIILGSIQRGNLFLIKLTSEKMARFLKFSQILIFKCFWTFTFDPRNDKVCKQNWSSKLVFDKS